MNAKEEVPVWTRSIALHHKKTSSTAEIQPVVGVTLRGMQRYSLPGSIGLNHLIFGYEIGSLASRKYRRNISP